MVDNVIIKGVTFAQLADYILSAGELFDGGSIFEHLMNQDAARQTQGHKKSLRENAHQILAISSL